MTIFPNAPENFNFKKRAQGPSTKTPNQERVLNSKEDSILQLPGCANILDLVWVVSSVKASDV